VAVTERARETTLHRGRVTEKEGRERHSERESYKERERFTGWW